MEKNKKGI